MGGITIFANVNVINNVIATNVMNDNNVHVKRIIAKIIAAIANAPKIYAEVSPLVAQTKNTVVGSSLKKPGNRRTI